MPKVMLGLVMGAILGCIDGMSAYLHDDPTVKADIWVIIFFSTLKGLLAGLAAGWAAKRWQSMTAAVGVGLVLGFLLSWAASLGTPYFLWIVLPGAAVGAIAGFAAQTWGRPAADFQS